MKKKIPHLSAYCKAKNHSACSRNCQCECHNKRYSAPRYPLFALSFNRKWKGGEKVSNFQMTRNPTKDEVVAYSADWSLFGLYLSNEECIEEEVKEGFEHFCISYLHNRGYKKALNLEKSAP